MLCIFADNMHIKDYYPKPLIDFCLEYKNSSANAVLLSKDSNIVSCRDMLYESTSFLDEIVIGKGIKIRFHCVLNNIHAIPKCNICSDDKDVGINKATKSSFTTFCSDVCRCSNNTFNRSDVKTEDLVAFRQKNMSYVAIGEHYGCSEFTVRSIIGERNLVFPSLNCTQPHVVNVLSDYGFMFNEYINENKTCEEIAIEIGSSKSEVAKWLQKLNIEAKSSNSYERKFHKRSKGEIELFEIVSSISNDATHSTRSILSDFRELDIYVPSKRFAIEFNGLLWHSELFGKKDKNYHSSKTLDCNENEIELWHIFDDHWNDEVKRDIWVSRIHSKLQSNKVKRIHGRKCNIRQISTSDKQLFLYENHLQGHDNAKYKYGLYHDGDLVAVMTFCKSRFNNNYDWELSRFAVKKYHHINGAFTKLLRYFTRQHKNDSIISYADKTYSNGNVYEANGFKLISELKHDYFYTKNARVRHNKRGFTKKKIKERCAIFDPNLTEWQNMMLNGYDRVWTCGTKTYILNGENND